MRIIGLYADEALIKFASTQDVNIWDVMMRSFLCEVRMDSLPEEVTDDPDNFILEPTDPEGRPIPLTQAYQYRNAN